MEVFPGGGYFAGIIRPGKHFVEVRKEGYETYLEELLVLEGASEHYVYVSLKPKKTRG
jgi:hypothetical protein